MAKLKATPKNFVEAQQALGTKSSVRLGNNTYLMRVAYDSQIIIAVILHATQIVRFYPDGRVTLHTGGYHTVTTKDRINQFIKGYVNQKNYAWFFTPRISDVLGGFARGKPVRFYDGINVA